MNSDPPHVYTKKKLSPTTLIKLELCSDGTVSIWYDDLEIGEIFTDFNIATKGNVYPFASLDLEGVIIEAYN